MVHLDQLTANGRLAVVGRSSRYPLALAATPSEGEEGGMVCHQQLTWLYLVERGIEDFMELYDTTSESAA